MQVLGGLELFYLFSFFYFNYADQIILSCSVNIFMPVYKETQEKNCVLAVKIEKIFHGVNS